MTIYANLRLAAVQLAMPVLAAAQAVLVPCNAVVIKYENPDPHPAAQ